MAGRIILELTETFRESYRKLPKPIQAKVQKQLRFLTQNPRHRSLHIHKLNGEWEFYIDIHYRCFFNQRGNVYTLLTVGTHKLVDRYRKR